MKKTILIMILLIAIFTISANAQEETKTEAQKICEYAESQFVVGLQIPSFIPYGNDVLNIQTLEGENIGYLETKNNILEAMECGETKENPTFIIKIKDDQTIKNIVGSKKPASTLNEEISQGNIAIEGTNFGSSVSSFFTKIAIKVASWFD
ncbi:hypothetical protein K9L67_01810 [Candidatus Woesearchaeota archaeon]|nr:hypothetical protein [Candidatus Woesearchaeota archaeon]MCF7900940.1 hypothetical protein [Candidatus Woesearchaeota archaeon]MCF8012862.1 hypothetical protein [Candidatus Woesearchaeota archaeon]